MRTVAILVILVMGCGKRDENGARRQHHDEQEVSPTEFPVKVHPNQLSEEYTINPAAADEKFRNKILETKMPWLTMQRVGGKTTLRAGRIVYRFASEEEAAKVKPSTFYRVRGRCDGLVGSDIVLSKVWILGEWEEEGIK